MARSDSKEARLATLGGGLVAQCGKDSYACGRATRFLFDARAQQRKRRMWVDDRLALGSGADHEQDAWAVACRRRRRAPSQVGSE